MRTIKNWVAVRLERLMAVTAILLCLAMALGQNPGGRQEVIKSGPITGTETWSGTIRMTGDVTITASGKVTIQPGTLIKADPKTDDQRGGARNDRVELIIDGGELRVEGTADNPVVFTTTGDSAGDWYGIRLVKHDADVVIKNCRIEKGINGLEILSSRVDVFPILENLTIQQVSGTGIYIKVGTLSPGAQALIKGCVVKNSGGDGISVSESREIKFEGCEASFNNGNGFSAGNSEVIVTNSTFKANKGRGVYGSGVSITLRGCTVQDNGGHGVEVNAIAYQTSSLTLESCTVQGNLGRGVNGFSSSITLISCVVSLNRGDWGVVNIRGWWSDPSLTMRNSAVRGNSNGVYHEGSEVTVIDSVIENNGGWGLYVARGQASRDGIKRNMIKGNKRGIGFGSVANPFVGVEGNDIYDNQEYDAVNDGGSAIVTENTFWGEPTTTEIRQGVENLTKIYDKKDDASKGEIQIVSYRVNPISWVTPITVNPGLYMFSSPVRMHDPWHIVFGIPEDQIKIAIWDTEAGQYRLYRDMTSSERLPTPGKSIWIKLDNSAQVTLRGILPEVSKPFLIGLKPGWNMIGVPWQVKWRNLKVKRGDKELSLSEASEFGWVYDVLWGWDGEKYQWIWARESVGLLEELEPLKGYWILAMEECSLVIPPKDEANRGVTYRQRFVTDNAFVFGLQASDGQTRQNVWLGCTHDGKRGLLLPQPPQPPEASSLQMFVLDKNGQPMAMDVRAGIGRRVEWDVVLRFRSRQAGREEITLTWEGAGYAPQGVSLTLIDLATGARRYMRTQTSYRFVPSEGEVERRFRLIVERDNERPLRIVNLQVTPLRGQGILIQFALTKTAMTQVEVLSLTGRQVAIVEIGQTRYAGQNTILWRGVGFDGRPLPQGVYLLRIYAQDQEGRQVQATRTMALR